MMSKPLILTMLGGLVCVLFLGLLLSWTNDLGVVSIPLSIVMAMLFFYLSSLLPSIAPGSTAAPVKARPISQCNRLSASVAIVLMAISFLFLTAILTLFFDSYDSQILRLISLGELEFNTSHGRVVLEYTFGGMLTLLFWLPDIGLSSYAIGRRSEPLNFWQCSGAVLISVGLFVIANYAAEIISGDISMDRVFDAIFLGEYPAGVRMEAEKGLIRAAVFSLGLLMFFALSLLVWFAAKAGHKHSHTFSM